MVKTKDKLATEKFVYKVVREATDAILTGMDKMFSNLKETIDKYHKENAAEHAELRHQISDLKHDTPTLKEFKEHVHSPLHA